MASIRRKRHKKRGRFSFLYKVFAVAALTVALFLGAAVFFRVEEMVVSGNARYTQEQIVEISQVARGDSLFTLDLEGIRLRLVESLPYIESVSIQRDLPDKLVLTVEESQAVAWVSGSDGDWLLSASGKALERVPAGSAAGIEILGLDILPPTEGAALAVVEEQQTRYAALLRLIGELDARGMLDKVTQLDLTRRSRTEMQYDGRFTVRLPVDGDYAYLLQVLEESVKSLESYEKGIMDLTMKNFTAMFTAA